MSMVGDGPEGQPTDGVVTVDDIADAMIGEQEAAPVESEEGEESDEAEGNEAEEEEQEEEAEEEEEEEDTTVKLKHDGKEVEVKLSEAIELAQKGFDYSQKTMAVAEERKVVETERKVVSELRTQGEAYLQDGINRLQAIAAFAQAQVGAPPSIELAHENAAQYIAQKHLFDQRQGQLQQALQAVEQLQEEAQQKRQAYINRTANETEEALRSTLPGWNDEMLSDYAKYADGLGLNPQTAELAFVQKGFWELIHKAKQFDALQAKKADLKPAKEKLAKVAKPSAQNQSGKVAERAKREAAFNKNPSVDSLAEFFR